MTATHTTVRFAFAIGEEVIVELAGLDVYDMDSGRRRAGAQLPAWTIAAIGGRSARANRARYLLRFSDGDVACICVAPESAIDGVA